MCGKFRASCCHAVIMERVARTRQSGDGDVSHNDADRHTREAWSKCEDISIGQFVLLTYRQFLF